MVMMTVNSACSKPKFLVWSLKRFMDIGFCLIALPILVPVLALVALAVITTSRGPAFFVQTRVGLGGKTFEMYKFRSMYTDAESRRDEVAQLSDREGICLKVKRDPRVTPLGRFLRRWSLDELPQAINVFKGDMSFVGPRPALTCEVAQYPEYAHQRHEVLPGITGLWQVSGRAEIGFDEMIALDLEYVRQVSVLTDVRILLRTVGAVLGGQGAY
ncbi:MULTISPECIES: sugar transferase [Roseobacteraceae]|uniref:Sugar transferase n=1 Tax=Falsiruegeria litorea TaxID=1280831 RepID=A0ABS5WN49_9RHOB|nr:sugar transferase [Falsiruegeria litorea]MBT8169622.1 sugar transferase [Falsiruegeria litorea]